MKRVSGPPGAVRQAEDVVDETLPVLNSYMLPRIRDRHAPGGMRPVTARERAKQLKSDESKEYFTWR